MTQLPVLSPAARLSAEAWLTQLTAAPTQGLATAPALSAEGRNPLPLKRHRWLHSCLTPVLGPVLTPN